MDERSGLVCCSLFQAVRRNLWLDCVGVCWYECVEGRVLLRGGGACFIVAYFCILLYVVKSFGLQSCLFGNCRKKIKFDLI